MPKPHGEPGSDALMHVREDGVATVAEESSTDSLNLSPDQQKIFFHLEAELTEGSAVNWDRILKSMRDLNPSPLQKTELARLTGVYISTAMKLGQFGNLERIQPVLDYLEISEVDFDPQQLDKINALLKKYSVGFLLRMSPSLYNGKLEDGSPYDKISYVRGLLEKSGASAAELTDEYISNLWQFREVLIRLHSRVGQDALSAGQRKLTGFIRLLNS